mmetsp:Transcript_4553/g.11473  ORF Transcript_4553/g.11473 Transcript_4553/m.11473 type:complete len:494 (+) Transcript_4553:426-1907(+)
MEAFPLGVPVPPHLHALAQLAEDDQIVDEGRGQQRVLARVVHDDGVLPPHEDFGGVLVHGALGVCDVGHVLDDDDVIGVLVLLEEDAIRRDHVVDHVRFANLLGAELAGRREVLPVVVPQVVVRDDGHRLNARGDEEVDHDALHLRLSRLEIVPRNEHPLLPRELDHPRHERVLRRSVDERAPLQDGRHREDRRRAHLGLAHLDGAQDGLGGVVHPLLDGREALRVGRPEEDYPIETVVLLKVANVLPDPFHLFLLRSREDVVGALSLVGGDEVGEVDGGQGLDVLHVGVELFLEVVVEDLGALHGIAEVGAVDVPSSPDDFVGVEEGEHVAHGGVDGVAVTVVSQLAGGGHEEGSPVVRLLRAFLGFPGEAHFVGNGAGDAGASIVSTETDQHHAGLAHLAFSLELHLGSGRFHGVSLDNRSFVAVVRNDRIVGILAGIGFHGEISVEIFAAAHDWCIVVMGFLDGKGKALLYWVGRRRCRRRRTLLLIILQ